MEPKEEIRERIDIADFIARFIELRPAGSGSFKALCPFHGEKTPSFHVSREKGIWHCFGCGKGGDAFAFLMEMEGLSFPEALQMLAKETGVKIDVSTTPRPTTDKSWLIDLHELATKFYETMLHDHPEGAIGREYIARRGITPELARKFRLGFAPDRWDALIRVCEKRGISSAKLVKAGLAKPRTSGNGDIDRFRYRLMVPLCDRNGRVVGFTGRLFEENEHAPKYLNSPDTPIYNKSQILFGFHLAKNAIRLNKRVIVVEGNLDVIASHKAGVEEVVASSGTALTADHVRQLKKFTDTICFAFDADAAGFDAIVRGVRIAQREGLRVRVIDIPRSAGKDPDDIVQKDPAEWRELCEKSEHYMDVYFRNMLGKFDVTTADGKRSAAQFIVAEIANITDPIEREHWLQNLSDIIRVDMETLKVVLAQQKAQVPVAQNSSISTPRENKTTKTGRAMAVILGIAFLDEEFAPDVFGRINPDDISDATWQTIYKDTVLLYTQNQSNQPSQKTLFSRLQEHFAGAGDALASEKIRAAVLEAETFLADLSRDHVRQELNRHISILQDFGMQEKRKELEVAIRAAEGAGDEVRLNELIKKYSQLL